MIEFIPFKHELLFSVNAENLYSTILPKTKGNHFYYILNLKTGVVKFGISNDVRARMVVHVGHFTCYGLAQPSDLIISCSQDSVVNAKDAETFLMGKASNHPLFKLIGSREFFLYVGRDTAALDVFFSDFIGAQELIVENNFSDKQLRNKTRMPNPIKRGR